VALRGTLGDFSLADILQLIGLQRKTGLLVLQRGEEQVRVGFENGRVVSAETSLRAPEGRIGQYLLRSGKLTEQRLEAALRAQSESLQRLGHLLVQKKWVDRETIRHLLTLQVSETVYDLFRWRDGEYDFQPGVTTQWDREFVEPIACETLLMQGAQMVDEWPLIERVIPSSAVVLQPTRRAAGILATGSEAKEGKGTVYEQDLDFGFIPADPLHEGDGGPRLGERERTLLRWVDGRRSAGEVAELAGLGTFESFKALAHLVDNKMLEPVVSEAALPAAAAPALMRSPLAARAAAIGVATLAVLGALSAGQALTRAFLPGAAALPLPPTAASAAWISSAAGLDGVRRAASAARLARVERGIHVYYLDTASWPRTLNEVVDRGFLPRSLARDPWGRPYVYEVRPESFRIAEAGPTAGLPAQAIERTLTPLERSASAAP
jgi:hypothetical protein